MRHINPPDTDDPLLQKITLEEIKNEIKQLSVKKARADDNINNKVIKSLQDQLTPILHHLFNISIEIGYIPEIWKSAQLCMIYKENKPKDRVESYRPISLISCVGKILEKILTNRLYKWCEKNNLINKEQSGFRSSHSTNEQLFKLTQHIKNGFNNKDKIIGVFLDMEKAFDRVWHAGLKFKLRLLGIPTKILRWISSFLTERRMRVNINGNYSQYIQPKYGVPQGSPLSPLLFILFVTDLAANIKDAEISQFADDIALYASNHQPSILQQNIQKNLNKISKWCNTWRIGINPDKSKVILFQKTINQYLLKKFSFTLQNIQIPMVKDANKLSFKKHIDETTKIIQKTFYSLISIKGIKYGPPTKIMMQLFKTFIRSKMEYGSTCLITASKSTLADWESLQINFIKHTFNFSTYINQNTIRKSANVATIYKRLIHLSKQWLTKIKNTNKDFDLYITSLRNLNNLNTPFEIIST